MSQDKNSAIEPHHVIAALVTNEPGVLAQVAGMFAARGFNIDSLVVGRTQNPEISRMTIVVIGNDEVLEQVQKQLQKLIPVLKVVDYHELAYVQRDLMLIQVSTDGDAVNRGQIIQIAELFRANVVDVSNDKLMIELTGTEDKLEAFIDMLNPYGVLELARTGLIAMPRGNSALLRQRALEHSASADNPSEEPKASDLPPG